METPQEKLDEVQERYAHGEARPLGGYVRALSVYGAAVAGLIGAVASRGGPPEELRFRDLGLATVASFRLARLITSASVTSPLRAPFTRYAGTGGPGEVREEVQEPEGGHRHAIGELVTCPYCFGAWTSTGLVFGLALSPRWTRLIASVLAVGAGSDALQKAYSDLQAR
ncbi:MAG: DUF1360 domain-containing protein [Actinobacteria bacterium]|nr:DUF1360 domain-containing protein [Actinomycetota bacterium]